MPNKNLTEEEQQLVKQINEISDSIRKRQGIIEEVKKYEVLRVGFLSEIAELGDVEEREEIEEQVKTIMLSVLEKKQGSDNITLCELIRKQKGDL